MKISEKGHTHFDFMAFKKGGSKKAGKKIHGAIGNWLSRNKKGKRELYFRKKVTENKKRSTILKNLQSMSISSKLAAKNSGIHLRTV